MQLFSLLVFALLTQQIDMLRHTIFNRFLHSTSWYPSIGLSKQAQYYNRQFFSRLKQTATTSSSSIQPYLNLLQDKHVLVVGDGDFSFSRALADWQGCSTLHTSTLETAEQMAQFYPQSTTSIAEIKAKGGDVFYQVDAIQLQNTLPSQKRKAEYDIIVWNFPHVAGKQNIRYNRQLLHSFFQSAPQVLHKDGSIIITLVEGQSGFTSIRNHNETLDDNEVSDKITVVSKPETDETWGASWKLIEQAGEAGLLITETGDFPWFMLPHYSPQGRRGNRGGFMTGRAEYFRLQVPALHRRALQAPLFASELHLWLPSNHEAQNDADGESSCRLDLGQWEAKVRQAARDILLEHRPSRFSQPSEHTTKEDVLFSVDVVDVYRCIEDSQQKDGSIAHTDANNGEVVVAIQLTYLSCTEVWNRGTANQCRVLLETYLPTKLNMRPRKERLGHSVSSAYPWFVTQKLGLLHQQSQSLTSSSEICVDNSASSHHYALRQRQLQAATDHLAHSMITTVSSTSSDDEYKKDQIENSLVEIDYSSSKDASEGLTPVPAGRLSSSTKHGLWQRRIGIIFRGRLFSEEDD